MLSLIGERLKEARGSMSQSDFSELLGISLSTLRRYESGDRMPDAELIWKLYDVRQVDPKWLVTGYGHMGGARESAGADSDPREEYAYIPFYDVALSAGPGREVLASRPKAYNAYRSKWLIARSLNAENLFEATVSGDSMEPELAHGDTVLVEQSPPTGTHIREGAIYVLRVGEDVVVKYLQRLPGDRLQVVSANAALYPPYVLEPSDFEGQQVEIVGRVVRQGRER